MVLIKTEFEIKILGTRVVLDEDGCRIQGLDRYTRTIKCKDSEEYHHIINCIHKLWESTKPIQN